MKDEMTENSPFTIRLAILADVDRLTELHMASFAPEEHVPVILGKRYVQATYRWLVGSKRAYTLVADCGGKIVGLVAVCDVPFTKPMFRVCLPEFILSLARNPALLFKRKLWQRLIRGSELSEKGRQIAHHPGVAQMTIGVVNAGFRGQGIFPALVEATKPVSKARGSRAIRAGIYKFNNPSRRVFVKNGWIEIPEMETSDTVFYMAYLDPDLPGELDLIE